MQSRNQFINARNIKEQNTPPYEYSVNNAGIKSLFATTDYK